jgi:hypothetical protein
VPGKDFERNSVVEFSRSGQEQTEQGRVRRRKTGTLEMKFTGTLIEDLIATVERAERAAQSDGALPGERLMVESLLVEPLLVESLVVEPLFVGTWFASVQEDRDYNPKFIGVA